MSLVAQARLHSLSLDRCSNSLDRCKSIYVYPRRTMFFRAIANHHFHTPSGPQEGPIAGKGLYKGGDIAFIRVFSGYRARLDLQIARQSATNRRPKSIHQCCAKGSPTNTLKALRCICIFLPFPSKTSFSVYTKPLFCCLLSHLNFQS